MPLIERSSYPGPPFFEFNRHLQTILPALREGQPVAYERERITTPDGDFLDLDWLDRGSRQLVLLSHGLEGSSDRPYIRNMAHWFGMRGWDVLAWNCRSCSGEINRARRIYHHGEIEDIGQVIDHALQTKDYERVALIGFSMGGNITLKYLGVNGKYVPGPVDRGIAFSSPLRLAASAQVLENRGNRIYKKRFMKCLSQKMRAKAEQYPDLFDIDRLASVRTWRDFDEHFSAPLCGFTSVDEFYAAASAENFIDGISVPSLLVTAQNDPIIPAECTPVERCRTHRHLHLEIPRRGGHVGFTLPGKDHTWMEERAWKFIA